MYISNRIQSVGLSIKIFSIVFLLVIFLSVTDMNDMRENVVINVTGYCVRKYTRACSRLCMSAHFVYVCVSNNQMYPTYVTCLCVRVYVRIDLIYYMLYTVNIHTYRTCVGIAKANYTDLQTTIRRGQLYFSRSMQLMGVLCR